MFAGEERPADFEAGGKHDCAPDAASGFLVEGGVGVKVVGDLLMCVWSVAVELPVAVVARRDRQEVGTSVNGAPGDPGAISGVCDVVEPAQERGPEVRALGDRRHGQCQSPIVAIFSCIFASVENETSRPLRIVRVIR